MPDIAAAQLSEEQFAKSIDSLAAGSLGRESLVELLREDHSVYEQRGRAAIVRMRGWVLLALAQTGVSDRELPFILEEFDTGTDAYLVAAAARALRSYPHRSTALTPFLIQALTKIREEPLSFEHYGEYATSSSGTTPLRELFATLAWLGPQACSALPVIKSMRAQPGKISKKLARELDSTVAAIERRVPESEDHTEECCTQPGRFGQRWWAFQERESTETVDSILFEDQDGARVRFRDFFHEKPSIVAFFYTRCDNPWKCSLTVTKMAWVERLLNERGLSGEIQTATITYDPVYDLPKRLRDYGQDRGIHFDAQHRMLRTTEGFAALRKHFHLGVNFIESLVNRHRIELYILDREGRIAARFERLHWHESEVVDRAASVLIEEAKQPSAAKPSLPRPGQATATTIFGTLASLAWAFFPKCPMCWAAYLSVFGIAGIPRIPYLSKTEPLLLAVILINLSSVWFRARATRRMGGFYLVCAGTLATVLAKTMVGWQNLAIWAVALTFSGSLWSVVNTRHLGFRANRIWLRLREGRFRTARTQRIFNINH
jgi:protein SCO1